MVLRMFVVLACAWSGAAVGQDEASDVKSMLDAIPEIEEQAPPVSETVKEPEEPQGMDLDAYFEECRTAVYAHFKMPKKIVKLRGGAH